MKLRWNSRLHAARWIRWSIYALEILIAMIVVVGLLSQVRNEMTLFNRDANAVYLEMSLTDEKDSLSDQILFSPRRSIQSNQSARTLFPYCREKRLAISIGPDSRPQRITTDCNGSWGNRITVEYSPGSTGFTHSKTTLRAWFENHRNEIPYARLFE